MYLVSGGPAATLHGRRSMSMDTVLKAKTGDGAGTRMERSAPTKWAEPVTAAVWPRKDYSCVPYRLYHDPLIYEREIEKVFQGPTWSFIGLEAEVPNPGDFRASYIGETPVVFNRDEDGQIKGFVNRCAHRGAKVVREISGNTK